RHFAHAGWNRNKMPHDWDETPDKYRHRSGAPIEITLGPFQVALLEQEIFTHLQHQWLSAKITHGIREPRADHGADARRRHGQPEIPMAIGDLESDEWHHGLARQRKNHALQCH